MPNIEFTAVDKNYFLGKSDTLFFDGLKVAGNRDTFGLRLFRIVVLHIHPRWILTMSFPLRNDILHDLNNTLTVIRGFAVLLAEELPIDAPGRAYAAEILAAADRVAALFSQPRGGAKTPT